MYNCYNLPTCRTCNENRVKIDWMTAKKRLYCGILFDFTTGDMMLLFFFWQMFDLKLCSTSVLSQIEHSDVTYDSVNSAVKRIYHHHRFPCKNCVVNILIVLYANRAEIKKSKIHLQMRLPLQAIKSHLCLQLIDLKRSIWARSQSKDSQCVCNFKIMMYICPKDVYIIMEIIKPDRFSYMTLQILVVLR